MFPCEPKRSKLAESPVCRVERCGCGTLHVTIGALTLRVDPDALTAIHATLGDALRQVESERVERLDRALS